MAVILFLNSFVATDVQKWVRSFETSATAYQSRRGHVPEDLNLHIMWGSQASGVMFAVTGMYSRQSKRW
jgi:hypothetical protein